MNDERDHASSCASDYLSCKANKYQMTADSANSHHTSGSRQVRSAARAEQPDARVAWHDLLQVSTRVIREFDRRLDREHRISAREFDVLINLDNAPDRRLRMTELAEASPIDAAASRRRPVVPRTPCRSPLAAGRN